MKDKNIEWEDVAKLREIASDAKQCNDKVIAAIIASLQTRGMTDFSSVGAVTKEGYAQIKMESITTEQVTFEIKKDGQESVRTIDMFEDFARQDIVRSLADAVCEYCRQHPTDL